MYCKRTLLSFAFILILCFNAEAQVEDLGYTKGAFTVLDAGAAIYNIHITVAAGVSGLQPDLNLTYSSQGGNGPLGLGWSIGGLSVVSRTSRTQAQDGGVPDMLSNSIQQSIENKVNFNLLDRYSLDGEKLRLAHEMIPENMWINEEYGFPGTVYFTEQNTFSKIVLVDTLKGSPTYFKVYTKDGLTKEYGNTDDSRIELSTNGLPIQWLVNKIEDRNGSFI